MDLLAGYGSGQSDSDDEPNDQYLPPHQSAPATAALNKSSLPLHLPRVTTTTATIKSSAPSVGSDPITASYKKSTLPSDFFDPPTSTGASLPPLPADFFYSTSHAAPTARATPSPILGPSKPSTAQTSQGGTVPASSLWSKLPAPKNSGRNVVNFTLPIKTSLLKSRVNPAKDDDLDRPAKRYKPAASGKTSLFDMLPPPKHASASSANLDLSEPTSKLPAGKQAPSQTLEHPAVGPSMYSNDQYRIDAEYDSTPYLPTTNTPAGTSLPDTTYYDSSTYDAQEQYGADAAEAYYPPDHSHPHHDPASASARAGAQAYYDPSGIQPPGPGATPEEEDIFQQALKAERERAVKRGGGAAAGDIKFVELTQQDLKYVPPAKQESHNALQNALGSEYAMEIRTRAKAHLGSKMARRKHQIGTLFHNAKMMELEMMEQRAQSMKTKAETAAKYGW